MLLGNLAQLWIQWDGQVDAAVVTDFIAHPQAMWVRIWLAGSREENKVDWPRFRELIREWGVVNRCTDLTVFGRLGWLRIFPSLKLDAVCLREKI